MKHINGLGARSALAVAIAAVALAGCNEESKPEGSNGVINLNAGAGGTDEGWGGRGGHLRLYKSTGEGHIVVVKEGSVNADLPVPALEVPQGENPLVISSAVTISPFEIVAEAGPAEGTPYFYGGQIYVSDGDTTPQDELAVTALVVNAGATLTVNPTNDEGGYSEAAEMTSFYVGAIQNNGTIKTGIASDSEKGSLSVETGYYVGKGTIDTRGPAGTEDWWAGEGGDVAIYANVIVNEGRILTAGAPFGENYGSDGGDVYLSASAYLQNTGTIDTRGSAGTNVESSGGDGGSVYMTASYGGPVVNAGDIITSGGKGGMDGGDAGSFGVAAYGGVLYNSGNYTGNGGAAGGDGSGGYGGNVSLWVGGNTLRNSGEITAVGGAGSGDGNGGYGGSINAYATDGDFYWEDGRLPAKNLAWSGDIDLRGGVAGGSGSGGYGGSAQFQADNDWTGSESSMDFSQPTTLTLYGYNGVQANGADGNYGGEGGTVSARNGEFWYYDSGTDEEYYVPGGGVDFDLDIAVNGGDALVGTASVAYGGEGGWVDIGSTNDSYYEDYYSYLDVTFDRSISVVSAITGNGGTGRGNFNDEWGEGAWVVMQSEDADMSFEGDVAINGGAQVANDDDIGYGGEGGYFGIFSDHGAVSMTGDVSLRGSFGQYRGGDGGQFWLGGGEVTHTGGVNATGGNGGLYGGYGGGVRIISADLVSSHTGTVLYAAGTGSEEDGYYGCFVLDMLVSGDCPSNDWSSVLDIAE